MTYSEAKVILESEYKFHGECSVFGEALTMAINALEKQIAKKPYKDNENGVYEKYHCPTCHRSLFPNDHHCKCGQVIDWSDEE